MRPREHLRLIRFIASLAASRRLRSPWNRGREELGNSFAQGRSFLDRYLPCATTRGTIIALHGVTLHGGRDERLKHFGRSLSDFGVTCIIPTLAGLGSCRFDEVDVDDIARLIELEADSAGRPVGIVGFCYGASLGILAAAADRARDHVDFVLAFGPYGSLGELFDWYIEAYGDDRPGVEASSDMIFIRLVLAYQHLESIDELRERRGEVESLLLRYCHDLDLEEKRSFYESSLVGLDIGALAQPIMNSSVFDALSPIENRLADLRCPVTVIHDPQDPIVPAAQGKMLFSALRQAAPDHDHQIVVTDLISHVNPVLLPRRGDLSELYRALSPLLFSEN